MLGTSKEVNKAKPRPRDSNPGLLARDRRYNHITHNKENEVQLSKVLEVVPGQDQGR